MTKVLNKTIGPYQLIKFVERDDLTIRYQGFLPSMDRYVTIHVLLPALTADQAFVRHFQRDIRRIASLQSPHILPIVDEGRQEGLVYFVTRYPLGDTLRAWRLATRTPQQKLDLSRALVNAVDSVHRQGLVHGNLKSSNILVEPQGRPLLTGFGFAQKIAEITTNTIYTHPDRVPGRAVDQRDDVYALGVILHELLLGEPPVQPFHQPQSHVSALSSEVANLLARFRQFQI